MEKLLKVCSMPQGAGYVPGLNLKGDYLKKFGFSSGDFVRVEISKHEIIIRKTGLSTEIAGMVKKNPVLGSLIREFDLIPV
jgi:hypothetical protein